jgi:hypothetical protein
VPVLAVIGTLIVAVKVPPDDVVILAGVVVSVVSSNFIVIALFELKLEPVTVTVAPRLPEVGDNDIVPAASTLKVALALLPVLSLAVIV